MKTFSHYIITRFNIKSSGWNFDKNGKTINDLTWLEERYDLFEKYCFPSMVSQTEQDYKWLVFFDSETPKKFIEKNKNFRKILPQFTPIYVENYLDFEEKSKVYLEKDANTDYLITSRFDNDDCFHIDAIKKIQQSFEPSTNTIIELSNGLTLKIGDYNKLAKRQNVHSGPFISYIQKLNESTDIKTVYDCEHTSWRGKANFISIDSGFYWLQIIHESNISNKLHNNLTINKNLLKGFTFNDDVNFSLSYSMFVTLKNMGVFNVYNYLKRILKKNNAK